MATHYLDTGYFDDNWNYVELCAEELEVNPKDNTSIVHRWINVVVPHSSGTPAYIHTNFYSCTLTGANNTYPGYKEFGPSSGWVIEKLIECTTTVPHDSDGTKNFPISGTVNTYVKNFSLNGSIPLTNIDRNGITISNYTLRECLNKQLYINFAFNYEPSKTYYRYRKSTESSWETNWIEWNAYGGSYNTSTKKGYFITPKLQANTNYVIEIKTTRDYNDVSTTKTGTFYVESSVFFKKNGNWVDGEVYIKKNNTWKKGTPYIKKNGIWKEAS